MKRKIVWIVLGILLLFFAEEYIRSKYCLRVSHYMVNSGQTAEASSEIRIVQLSDLHNSCFGSQNQSLVNKVKAEDPDLILMTGDMLNSFHQDTSNITELIQQLSEIAQVYVSYGNHEKDYEIKWNMELSPLLSEAGAHMLDDTYEDIEIKGHQLRLGGVYGYARTDGSGDNTMEHATFLSEFQDTERYTILLCHIPTGWSKWDNLETWDIDLVFCGHTHAGQIQIPFVGGLYAPEEGFFVGKDQGCYFSKDGKREMILSAGLGTAEKIPRLNNVPEIVSVTLY